MTRTCLMISTALMLAGVSTTRLEAADHQFSIPSQDLGSALGAFAAQSGEPIVASATLVAGRRSGGAHGMLSSKAALDRLLKGSGLHADLIDGAFVVRADEAAPRAERIDPEIVVTGTRIRGAVPVGSPVMVIDRKAIDESGRATVAGYLETLPQNYAGGPNEAGVGTSGRNGSPDNLGYGTGINLRGLGTQSTLVLFDGNRPALGGNTGAFADISLIPSSVVDRIEILTDGASAIYGTDAVAGVVNIRFKDRFDGAETRLYSGTANGGANQIQLGQILGKRWHDGGLVAAIQYDRREALSGADRAVATNDLRRFGGPDARFAYGAPGNVIAADGQVFGIPAGQDGRALSASDLKPGVINLTDVAHEADILPRQRTLSAYIAGDQQIREGLTAYGRVLYARRRFSAINHNIQSFRAVTVPVSNPFYVDPLGTAQPVRVAYDFAREVGDPTQAGSVAALTSSGGLKGRIGAWAIDANGSYGRDTEHTHDRNLVSYSRVASALADPDPATALNLFGDGTGNNPATIARLRAGLDYDTRYAVWSTSLRGDGPLFELPAGAVKLATGYEHRDERFTGTSRSTTTSVTPLVTQASGTPGHRSINAIYGELAVPLSAPGTGPLPGRLDLSASGRVDWYSDVGRTVNPKLGARWEPVEGLAVRGSWGTAFRAPGFRENVGDAQNFYQTVVLADPRSPSGQTTAIAIIGYAPTIGPEKATSWTAGLDIKPRIVPGFSASVTYFDIAYRD